MKTLYAVAQETKFKRARKNASWMRQQARTIKMRFAKRVSFKG
jgi:hypothetical protein